jgi:glycosyltransferase involved in cell wall biosynthesis
VLFAGWLDQGRGLREVITLARRGVIQLIVAGEGDERIRDELSSTPNVEYRGFCTHGQIMDLTRECDYVAAFYDPVRRINRYAASNKIAEALAVGRPILTNSELFVASSLQAAEIGVIVPYAGIRSIDEQLSRHWEDRAAYLATCTRARRLYETDYHSSQVRLATISALNEAGLDLWHSTTQEHHLVKS